MAELAATIRKLAKSSIVAAWGSECRPRRILWGLASGYRICVSPKQHLSYLLGTAEPHLQRAIRNYVARGDTVYDIGANLGYVSLSLAKQVGPSGSVIAFEPVPQNIEGLWQNISINGITNIRLMECAASDKTGAATMRIAGNFSTASLVWHKQEAYVEEISIQTVRIDDLVERGDLKPPRFVKIDVEGAEGLVLDGMHRTIREARPVLFVKCSELGRRTAWNLLTQSSYRCESAIARGRLENFDAYRHSDFLWLPKVG
jgi:FkbM family methyltransferase